jgi:hypothetical protein
MATVPTKSNIWNYNDPPLLPMFSNAGALAQELFGTQLPQSKEGVQRFFSLYWYLLHNLDVPLETLRLRILNGKEPVFSAEQLASVVTTIRSQLGTPFAQRMLRLGVRQMGGDAGPTTPPVPVPTEPIAGSEVEVAEADPSRSKFWDVFLKKRLYNLTKGLPPAFDGFVPIVFALYSLEQIKILGPLIASFLDSITLGLPTLGKVMGTALAKMISLAPIPYAGPVGDIAAYFICLVFIMLSATMSVSRKQFGTSFTVGVGAVPVFGDQISDAALLFEKQVERYDFNKGRIVGSVGEISPHMAEFIDYWTPSPKGQDGPPVVFDPDLVLLDLFRKAVETLGEDQAMASVTDPTSLPASARNLVRNPEYKAIIGPKKSGGRRRTRRIRR